MDRLMEAVQIDARISEFEKTPVRNASDWLTHFNDFSKLKASYELWLKTPKVGSEAKNVAAIQKRYAEALGNFIKQGTTSLERQDYNGYKKLMQVYLEYKKAASGLWEGSVAVTVQRESIRKEMEQFSAEVLASVRTESLKARALGAIGTAGDLFVDPGKFFRQAVERPTRRNILLATAAAEVQILLYAGVPERMILSLRPALFRAAMRFAATARNLGKLEKLTVCLNAGNKRIYARLKRLQHALKVEERVKRKESLLKHAKQLTQMLSGKLEDVFIKVEGKIVNVKSLKYMRREPEKIEGVYLQQPVREGGKEIGSLVAVLKREGKDFNITTFCKARKGWHYKPGRRIDAEGVEEIITETAFP